MSIYIYYITFIIYVICAVIIITRYPKYTLLIPLILYMTPLVHELPDIGGVSSALVMEVIVIVLPMFIISLKKINILRILKQWDFIFLYILYSVYLVSRIL